MEKEAQLGRKEEKQKSLKGLKSLKGWIAILILTTILFLTFFIMH